MKFETFVSILTCAGIFHELNTKNLVSLLIYPTLKLSKILRSVKYLRIFKIFFKLNKTKGIKKLTKTIIKVMLKIKPYIIFYLLMVLIFSLIGYNIFYN